MTLAVAPGVSPKPAKRSGNVRGNSKDPNRGKWCTPEWLAKAVGPFDLDPFSNPHSHIVSEFACMLEDGGDGFGAGVAGSFRVGKEETRSATERTSVWLQPPYELGFVSRAFEHYRHTRWVALLRFDPRPKWFDPIFDSSELVCVIRSDPNGDPFGFEPPPGVAESSNTFPHALYYRCAEDVTSEVLRWCIAWRKRVKR